MVEGEVEREWGGGRSEPLETPLQRADACRETLVLSLSLPPSPAGLMSKRFR
jgi:hypothetical protein